jgi:hypothetical protein
VEQPVIRLDGHGSIGEADERGNAPRPGTGEQEKFEMNRFKTNRRIGMAAAALLLGTTVGFAGPPANAGIVRGSFTPYTASGRIEIAWGSTAPTVTHFDANGAVVGSPIPLAVSSKCEVTNLAALADILSITSSPNSGISLYDNGLGITTNGNCTPANGRVVLNQSLTLSLGSRFASGSQQMIGGSLDVEGKYSAGLRYSTDGGVTTRAVVLSSARDNGSDASSADNSRVAITSTNSTRGFTSLRLEPTGNRSQAAIALDNGGDWADRGANKTVIQLGIPGTTFEYTVNCGDVVDADALDNQSNGLGQDSVVAGVSFFRLANKYLEPCLPIGVSVQASNGGTLGNDDDVLIDNSLTSADGIAQNVRARVRIIWVVETDGKLPAQVEAELAREINYTPGDAAGLHPVQWCTSVPPTVTANPLTATDLIVHPTGEPWCLLSDIRVISGTTITQTQIYSGNGDPQWR